MTFPTSEPGSYFSPRVLMVLKAIAPEIVLITGTAGLSAASKIPNVKCFFVPHRRSHGGLKRIVGYCATQVRLALQTILLSSKVDIWVFHTGGDTLIVPMAASRLMRKPAVLVLTGSSSKTLAAMGDRYARLLELVSAMTTTLASRICVYTSSATKAAQLKRLVGKVTIAHEHFVNLADFREHGDIDAREPIVGYLGRLSREKGILNLLDAAAVLLAVNPEIRFIIGGTGPLENEIKTRLKRADLQDKVDFLGFIEPEKVPEFLNRLKLLVLPSYTEGLPMAVVEAMACGVPVLVTPTGSLGDLVLDGSTGFLAKDNTPQSLAFDISRALSSEHLSEIAIRARHLAESRFTYTAAVDGYRRALAGAAR